MSKFKNPKAKCLTWKSMRGWEMVTIFDISSALDLYREDELPQTFIGKVRLFLELAKHDEMNVRLNRYFDTWDYEQEQKKLDQIEQECKEGVFS